jgi:DNA-binding CsgD family transcriptional regulator
MSRHLPLVRKVEKLISYLNENSRKSNIIIVEDVLPLMHTLHKMFPQYTLMICPLHHPQARYISDNCLQLFGFSSEQFIKEVSKQDFFSRVHDDDVEDVHKCFSFFGDFMKDILPEQYPLYRCVFTYRWRHSNGSYVLLQDEKAILRLPGFVDLYYSIFKDISEEKIFSGVKVELYKQEASLRKVGEYRPLGGEKRLSKRENQLVGLIQKGLTTKEIASYLQISHHTVRNIRQKMFEKYNVNNAIELLNKTVLYN